MRSNVVFFFIQSITKCKFFEWIDPPACDCKRDKQLQNRNIEKPKTVTDNNTIATT